MSEHLIDGEFQSDKYPTTPRGLVPLKCSDKRVQDLLWEMAQRYHTVDEEFAADLEIALQSKGFKPKKEGSRYIRMEYDIRGLPMTWIPALLIAMIETAEKKQCFTKHGLMKMVRNVLNRIRQEE